MAVSHALYGHADGERVYYGGAYAVKTARDLVSALAELSAGVEDRHYYLERGLVHLGMLVYRHASAVVRYVYGIVFSYYNVYVLAVAGQSLVHGVVDYLIDKVVQTPAAGGPYVHSGPFPYRIKALKDLYLFGVILAVFLCDIL